MKKIILTGFIFTSVISCTKSETQYNDQKNKKQTVNNQKSDTINTLEERSDTLQMQDNLNDVSTDNE